MDSKYEKIGIVVVFLLLLQTLPVSGNTLKLSDAPLSKLVELYAQETKSNVFMDESVQSHRKVTAHLNGLPLKEAFQVVLKTIGLEAASIAENTIVLFPPSKANRYKSSLKPIVMEAPTGIKASWLSGLLKSVMPSLKVATVPGEETKMVLFGPEMQINGAKKLAKEFPKVEASKKVWAISADEARFLKKKLGEESLIADENGLQYVGTRRNLRKVKRKVEDAMLGLAWSDEVFQVKNLLPAMVLNAAKALPGNVKVTDLGGTGAFLIAGPKLERKRLINIFKQLDEQQQVIHKEIELGDIKTKDAKAAIKASGIRVKTVGEKNLVLIGKKEAVQKAEAVLSSIGAKRKQVQISFKLAEVSRSRLKKLGIDLDKNGYSYDEIKQFHDKDTLPLLLRVLNEGKHAKMLATPNLRVIEGEEGKITIGDRIPLEVEATAQTDSGSTLKLNTQLQWVDVGIKMTVDDVMVGPQKSVRMKLKGEVSSVVSLTAAGFPQIRTREALSTLRLKDGGSVIMAGLVNKFRRETNTRIPLVSKIPLVGGFARSRDRERQNSEIIMVVTARVVGD